MLWDVRTGDKLGELIGHNRAISAVSVTADGEWMFSAGKEGTICRWRLADQQLTQTWLQDDGYCRTMLVSRNGKRLLVSNQDGRLEVWDSVNGAVVESITPLDSVRALIQAADSDKFIAVDVRGGVHEIHIDESLEAKILFRSLGAVDGTRSFACLMSPDKAELMTCDAEGRVRGWPVSFLGADVIVGARMEGVRHFSLESGGATFIASDGQQLTRRETATLRHVQTVAQISRSIASLLVLPSGDLLTLEVDGESNAWLVRRSGRDGKISEEASAGTCVSTASQFQLDLRLNGVIFSKGGETSIEFALLEPLRLEAPMTLLSNPTCLAHDSRYARFAHAADRTISVCELTSQKVIWSQPQNTPVRWMGFTADGESLVVSTEDRLLQVWDAATGKLMRTMLGHRGQVGACVFSSDGQTLISGDTNGELNFWHFSTGDLLGTVSLNVEGGVHELELTPNDERLLVRLSGPSRALLMNPMR